MSWFAVWAFADDRESIDGDDVASNQGYAQLVDWAMTLDEEDYPELCHLADYGEVYPSEGLQQLEAEIDRAVSEKPADPPADVIDTLTRLKGLVQARPEGAAWLGVTDGSEPE